jgi:hypothetical protein
MVPKSTVKSANKRQKDLEAEFVKKDIVQKPALLWLLFLAIHAFIIFYGSSHSSSYNIFTRDWGFNNISYYSLPWILLFYLINIAMCIPSLNGRFNNVLEHAVDAKLFQIIGSRKFLKGFVFILIGIVSIGVFRLFKIKYNFLGDMDIRVQQTLKQEFVDTEALTMFVMYQIYKLLNSWGGLTGLQTFQWVSYFAGGAFIILSLYFTDELIQGTTKKALFFLFYLCFGTIQMFFGYVEVYCLPALSVLVYLYTGVLYIKGRVWAAVPIIALLAAIGLHLLSVALIPSIIVLLFYRKNEKWIERNKITIVYFVGLLVISVPIIYIIAPELGVSNFVVPFVEPQSSDHLMTLLSPEHLWEFFNSQMLAGGMGFFLFFLILFISIKKKMKYDITMWFFATGGLGMLFLTFITNAVRGSGDWDILAFPSLIYNVFGIYVVLTKSWPRPKEYQFRYVIPIFLVFNGMNAAAWVGINASDRSIMKIEHMIIGDPGNLYQQEVPNESSLAANYGYNQLEDKAWEFIKKAYERHPDDPRTHRNYAHGLLNHDQTELGLKILENLIIIAPQYPPAYYGLLDYYSKKNDRLDTYRVSNKLFEVYMEYPNKFKIYGSDNLKQAFTFLRDVAKSQGNEQRVQLIDRVLSQLK